ncbi:hypothetical protein B2G74_27565 [Burkholderia sp. A27]|nr:hypothetical protein B2G74_27565 [Burkholderia sp. A27]
MLAAALALLLFGWFDSASAQKTNRFSHGATVLSDCQDMMRKIRQQYGRAPLCSEIKGPGGQSLTELDGLVGLTDDMKNSWYQMRIATDPLDPTRYHYNASDLNNVIVMIRYSHRGLTDEQMGRALTNNACTETKGKLKALRDAGTLTERQYQSALSDFPETVSGCAK